MMVIRYKSIISVDQNLSFAFLRKQGINQYRYLYVED